jgi:protein-S-isoprenylcysteine O-methyltransferase Ste14
LLVTIFKLAQFITMGVFVVFISDFRKKTGMVPLVNEKITTLLKLSYFVPVTICAYTLATIDYLTPFDFVALALTFVGAVVVVKAKLDLGICHTWAGYCKQSSELEVSGIYSYIRHPLYMGVHLFSIGGLVMLTVHAQWYLTVVAVIMGLFMITFLAIAASNETAYLTKNLGEHFIRYRERVHPFLPIKKYS